MKHRLEILNTRDSYMIGDWVKFKGKQYQWKADDYFLSQMGMKDVEPIPLTEEILEKNGFSYIARHFCVEFYSYVKDGFALAINHKSFYIYCAMCHVNIKYVHELQRALRCCGLYDLANDFKVE